MIPILKQEKWNPNYCRCVTSCSTSSGNGMVLLFIKYRLIFICTRLSALISFSAVAHSQWRYELKQHNNCTMLVICIFNPFTFFLFIYHVISMMISYHRHIIFTLYCEFSWEFCADLFLIIRVQIREKKSTRKKYCEFRDVTWFSHVKINKRRLQISDF